VLVDVRSAVNILSGEVIEHIEIYPSRLTPMKNPIIRIESLGIPAKGALEIPITIATPSKCVSLQQTFMVMDMNLAYNTILGRPIMDQINAVINTRNLVLRFPTQKRVATI